MGFIWYIIIGIIAGFLAGKIMLGICPFRTCGFGIDWKFDNFYRRSYSGIMDCFFILEI